MALDFRAASDEYLGWLQLEANRSPNTVRAYSHDIRRLGGFLADNGHSLQMADLRHEDLRAYQRHLAGTLRSPASRARALVAVRSWLRWLARERLLDLDLSNGITLPKLEQRLPKPIEPEELARLLSALPGETPLEKRNRALVHFLISTGCRISEALALERTDIPRQGNRLIVERTRRATTSSPLRPAGDPAPTTSRLPDPRLPAPSLPLSCSVTVLPPLTDRL